MAIYSPEWFYQDMLNTSCSFEIKKPNFLNFQGKISENRCFSKNCAAKSNLKQSGNFVQELPENLYFIRMQDYGQNHKWAREMNKLTDELAEMVFEKQSFKKIVKTAQENIWSINAGINVGSEYSYFGVRKTKDLKTGFEINSYGRGLEYCDRYYYKFFKDCKDSKKIPPAKVKSNSKYKKANTCSIYYRGFDEYAPAYRTYVSYAKPALVFSNLNLCRKEYDELLSKKNPSLDEILNSTATIHWLIAQETPWIRGSDSIANVITKSILRAYNIELSPIKPGHSFDFEAFYRDLDDYIKIYPSLFEKNPRFLNKLSVDV